MRVKCPNSDIILELPGDKMDMKFTCPACKKVHRVTVTITTPGEIMTPAKTPPPQMPKKYATGAYPPVVDIPIDADFVLFDSNAPQQIGIDLGQAAEPVIPPYVDSRISERQTEIRRDPPSSRRKTGEDGDSSAASAQEKPGAENELNSAAADKDKAASQAQTNSSEGTAAQSESTVAESAVGEKPRSSSIWEEAGDNDTISGYRAAYRASSAPERRRPRSRGKKVAVGIALIILAAAGYLGWQQYLHSQNRISLSQHLAAAQAYADQGDIAAAAESASAAAEKLRDDRQLHTVDNLWNAAAGRLTFLPKINNDDAAVEQDIQTYLSQKKSLDSFKQDISRAPAEELPALLATVVDSAQATGSAGLAKALGKAAVDQVLPAGSNKRGQETTPEQTVDNVMAAGHAISYLLDPDVSAALHKGGETVAAEQADLLRQEVSKELAEIDAAAERGEIEAVQRYKKLQERLGVLPLALETAVGDPAELLAVSAEPQWEYLDQVANLAKVLREAEFAARSVLSLPDPEDTAAPLTEKAEKLNFPSQVLADETVKLIDETQAQADQLLGIREDAYLKLQSENRRDKITPGTMTAWRLILAAFGNREMAIDPDSFLVDSKQVGVSLVNNDVPLTVAMTEKDFDSTIRAKAYGYELTANWSPFFNKPLTWITDMAKKLRSAKVDPIAYPRWEVMEGPGGLVAVTAEDSIASSEALSDMPAGGKPGRFLFMDGIVHPVEEMRLPADVGEHEQDFLTAAKALHEGIMADESISSQLRQALKPVLMGTYLPIDPRDYFDAVFCRRLIEADYLETYIQPMPPERQKELDAYRLALGKLEAGFDEFAVTLESGERIVAVASMDHNREAGSSGDQDLFSGELIPRYTWRTEQADETVYYSPMPSRFNYAFSLVEHFDGKNVIKPQGAPRLTEVWHATKGLIASYKHGDERADGDEELWNEAIASDVGGPLNPVYGPPGWNFPLHVLEQNDQGDPLTIATLDGIVKSPDFSALSDAEERRRLEDEWLDSTAATFSTPGELGLIFHHFFRYCSDSPLPELPNLIGSHFGLSDTHQTVYQSLERRWVGRLIGDCDDLAEVFQVLTSRQGKLSYVMNLPSHAACGYVDKLDDGSYRFIVLQTGQVLQFNGKTLNDVVETAYRSFDRSAGESHLTMDAVPLLLRFADEETRTPFVLSARIYEDRDYADAMIRVQAYWHENVLSAAMKEMETMLETDKDVGNVKELGSLYERVGKYEESARLRKEELTLVEDNPQAKLSTLLELAQLYIQDKDKAKALDALHEMEKVMLDFTRDNNVPDFMRALSFRSQWAILLSRLGEPSRAWSLVKYDVDFTKRQQGYIADQVLRTLIYMYDKMSLNKEFKPENFTQAEQETFDLVGKELENAFVRGVFKEDDDYTRTIIRYFLLGRYAIAGEGRLKGLELLNQDGPYPDGPKDQTKRTKRISEDDWAWMRIVPQLYLVYGMDMIDQEEFPELYNPQAAKPLLENVKRAVAKGTGLGSDIVGSDDMIRSEMTLSFINRDLEAFRKTMSVVKEKNHSRLYDDIAMAFGLYCGLIPLEDFDAWIEAFRDYFPGKQHYFKVVYRAIDKENYDHALKMAEATAHFFPDEKLLVEEAEFVRNIIPELKARKLTRPQNIALSDMVKPAA